MAKNRIEQQTLIDDLTPTVDLSEDKVAREVDSFVFKKDVAASVNVAGGVASANFSTNDRVKVSTSSDATITVSGLEEGQVAKLVIIKSSTNIITFSGVDDRNDSIDYGLTRKTYLVVKTDGRVIATQIDDKRRSFVLGGTPGPDLTIQLQNNYIFGNFAYLNLKVFYNGGEDIAVDIGTLPFENEIEISGDQYMNNRCTDVGILEGGNAFYIDSQNIIIGAFGKTAKGYHISGTIIIK